MTDAIPPMVERIARVLCQRYLVFQGYAAGDLSAPMYWEVENEFGLNLLVLAPKDRRDEGSPAWEWFVEDARAVIEAMREMPDDIVDAGIVGITGEVGKPSAETRAGLRLTVRRVHARMIDTALGKGKA